MHTLQCSWQSATDLAAQSLQDITLQEHSALPLLPANGMSNECILQGASHSNAASIGAPNPGKGWAQGLEGNRFHTVLD
jgi:hypothetical protein